MQKEIQIGINEIVQISYGTLLNRPSISYFAQICDVPEAVKKGDLFVATNKNSAKDDIELAIKNGAFGILFSGDIAMSDMEVAWIGVEDLEQALVRILRYFLLANNKILFLLQKEEYEIATQIIEQKKSLSMFCGSIVGLISHILSTKCGYILYCNRDLDLKILPKDQQQIKLYSLEKIEENELPFTMLSYSLFTIKIFYKNAEFTLPIPKLFVQQLARVLRFCADYSFSVNLENLSGISQFKPLYLDEKGVIAKSGTTNRVILACENPQLYGQLLAYFTLYAKWAKLMLFVPHKFRDIYKSYETRSFRDRDELFNELLAQRYNFAIILGISTAALEEHFSCNVAEVDLFTFAE
ncbi:MAG: hypothetical protein SOW25_06010 [Helicobacter sp.]|nr:hypothetical protein [Helicobacteraceae bacterium]MDY3113864.1 hypothetical protein [Helicobacter sp.]